MAKKSTRREFLSQTAAGAIVLSAGGSLNSANAGDKLAEIINARQAPVTGRVLGANDRVNFGFIGMGGRMGAHTSYIANRQTSQADIQAVAVCDIYEKNKKRGQAQTKVADKDIHHDYRELCARKDIDAVVIATPDHWHARHAMEALNHGKHVYLEKPMTYTIEEARDLARKVKATGLQLQVGSQHLSDIQHWKAREIIQSGLIGKVLWASTSYARNTPIGEWNYYKIDADEEANEKTIDWKAFLGYAKKRAFDKDRFFRWRKYWDYSGGIATDLFYHRLSPLMFAIGAPEFPTRVTGQGGIFSPVEGDIREVPDTYFTTIEFPGKYAVMLGSSMLNATNLPEAIRGTKGTIYLRTREFQNGRAIRVVPERPSRAEFNKQVGSNELVIDVSGNTLGGDGPERPTVQFTTNHMANFINAMRGTEKVHFDAELGYKAMVAIRLGVDAYRSGQTMYFDARREKATTKPLFRA
ncbi:MAG: Gfo/Idh/MocA family oxidoreductase [Blastocatellales bacterium]